MINAGTISRPIEIETPIETISSIGETIKSWALFADLWAGTTPISSTERFQSEGLHSTKVYKFTVRWFDGINAKMRLKFDSQYWRITGISEIGRQKGLEILAELIE